MHRSEAEVALTINITEAANKKSMTDKLTGHKTVRTSRVPREGGGKKALAAAATEQQPPPPPPRGGDPPAKIAPRGGGFL